MTAYIYALVDPATHMVRYVGQTRQLTTRYRAHCSGTNPTTGAWVRSLPEPPVLVLLETVERKRIPTKSGVGSIHTSAVAETKWMKRFRRTILNQRIRESSTTTWDWLKNPDEAA